MLLVLALPAPCHAQQQVDSLGVAVLATQVVR